MISIINIVSMMIMAVIIPMTIVIITWTYNSHGALRRFKQQKIPQRWKVAFLEGIDEYIHPPKFQKLAIGGFWKNGIFVFFYSYGVKSSCRS